MGKIKGEIYKYYKLKFAVNDPNNTSPRLPKWQCRFCSRTYVQNATKMRHHVLNMCEEIPAPLKLALLDIPNIHDSSNDDSALEILNTIGVGCSSTDGSSPKFANRFNPSKQPPKKRKSVSTPYSSLQQPEATTTARVGNNNLSIFLSSPNNNLSTVSTVDQESLSVLLSRAILASGSSLSLLENPYWIDAFHSISPGITLPTKQSIMKDFLDQEFQQYQQDNEKQITDAKFVSMQCEAWMNNRDESLVTIVVNTPSPVSYKTFLTGDTNLHDPIVIADYTNQTIRGIGGESKVLSLVTNTNSHMTGMWTHVKSEYPNIMIFGCVVEALNILLVSILEKQQVSDILQTFKGICRKIKSSSAVKSKFDQIQRQINGKVQKLNLPSRSNLISHVVFIQSVQNVQGALKLLAIDDESRPLMMMSDDELQLLVSDELWSKTDILCKLLHPVVKWLTHMKKKPEIYLVSKAFFECKRVFDVVFEENSASIWRDTLYPELLDCLAKVKASCMQNVHLAANLLDPVEQGSLLTQEEILQATEFIDNFCDAHDFDAGKVVTELSQFRMKTDFYAKNFLWKVTEKVQGSMWWSTMAPKTHLAQVASALLNIAPSTFSMNDPGNNCFVDSSDCKYICVTHNLRMNSQALTDSKDSTTKRPHADTTSGEDKKPFSENGGDLNSLEIMCNLSDTESDAEMVESTEMSTDHIV